MSEVNENLNEAIEETVYDATVITVPIDDTLQNSGEAADAKAVGDALALKADRSELSAAITVDGQSADNQGVIILLASHIPMTSSAGADSVKDAIDGIEAWDSDDIPYETGGNKSIKDKIDDLAEGIEAGVTDAEIDAIFDNYDSWEEE